MAGLTTRIAYGLLTDSDVCAKAGAQALRVGRQADSRSPVTGYDVPPAVVRTVTSDAPAGRYQANHTCRYPMLTSMSQQVAGGWVARIRTYAPADVTTTLRRQDLLACPASPRHTKGKLSGQLLRYEAHYADCDIGRVLPPYLQRSTERRYVSNSRAHHHRTAVVVTTHTYQAINHLSGLIDVLTSGALQSVTTRNTYAHDDIRRWH